MEEQNEDVAHAAWYQTALTSRISAGLVIRHAQVNGDGISTLELRDSASQLFHPPGDLVSERALQFAVDLRVNFVAADALLVIGTST